MADQTVDQARQRRTVTAVDQFGRKWAFNIELKTGDPTGGIVPNGWTDTNAIPQKYMKVPRDSDGQPINGRIEIDFAAWKNDQKVAFDDRRRMIFDLGRQFYKKASPEAVKTWETDEYLLDMVGPPPRPSIEELVQWEKGDFEFSLSPKSVEIPEPEPEAEPEPFAEMTYKKFLADAMKNGMTMAEGARAWKAHRENLQEMKV